jgi:dihydrodipicolinate synthase/N-acetylneuraminate lyase
VVLMGGHGGVCGGANLFPKLFLDSTTRQPSGTWKTVPQLQ